MNITKKIAIITNIVFLVGATIWCALDWGFEPVIAAGSFIYTILNLLFLEKDEKKEENNNQVNEKIIKQEFTDSLVDFFEDMKLHSNDFEIVKWGVAISHPLWLSQKYEIRKKIGEFVERAAFNIDDRDVRIKTLIDDLGWMNVELKQFKDAEKELNRGIQLAFQESNFHYLVKGYRHLFSLNLRTGRFKEAEEYLNKSIERTNSLTIDKDELIAENHFAKSSLELKKGNYNEALNEINIAIEMYKTLPDKEWSIKILARKGEIVLSLNSIDEARDLFHTGLKEAKKYQFKRQIVKNLIGLGKTYFEERKEIESKKYFNQANSIAKEIGMIHELGIIEDEMRKFKN